MLFKNGELIKLDEEQVKDPLAKDILEKFEEIRKNYNFPIRIKTRFGIRRNKTGEREPTQSILARFEGDYTTKNGVKVRLRYSKAFPKKKNNGSLDYPEGSGELVERYMIIGEDEIDKAYFMLYVCPIVKKGLLKVENKQKEAASELEALSRMAVVNYFLTDPSSDLYADHDRIRTLALSFGVSHADDTKKYSVEEVKMKLIKSIAKGEASKDPIINVKEFKEAISIPQLVKKRAAIQKAIDKGALGFNQAKYYWYLVLGDEQRKILDVDVSSFGTKEELLVKELMNNDDKRELFDKAVGKKGAFSGAVKLTAEEIDSLGIADLRSRCSEVGIPAIGAGRTAEVLKKELKEHYGL